MCWQPFFRPFEYIYWEGALCIHEHILFVTLTVFNSSKIFLLSGSWLLARSSKEISSALWWVGSCLSRHGTERDMWPLSLLHQQNRSRKTEWINESHNPVSQRGTGSWEVWVARGWALPVTRNLPLGAAPVLGDTSRSHPAAVPVQSDGHWLPYNGCWYCLGRADLKQRLDRGSE